MEGIGNIEGRAASLQVEELIGWAAFMEVEEFSRTPITYQPLSLHFPHLAPSAITTPPLICFHLPVSPVPLTSIYGCLLSTLSVLVQGFGLKHRPSPCLHRCCLSSCSSLFFCFINVSCNLLKKTNRTK